MYNKRRYLRNRSDPKSKEELEEVEDILAERYGKTMYNKIKKEAKSMSAEEGGFNPGKLWNLKKKLSPRHIDPPTAMTDSNGKLLTNNEDIKAEAMKHYRKVFENKPIDDELKDHQTNRERLCQERLSSAYHNKTPS